MKKHVLHSLLLTGLAGTLLLGSCGLIGSDSSEENDTYFRATLNGEEKWKAEGTSKTNQLVNKSNLEWLTLHVARYPEESDRYSYREALVFIVMFRGSGSYSLVEEKHDGQKTGSSYSEREGDVIISSYSPTENTSANRLTITHYDSTTGLIEGTFRTTVVVDSAERVSEPGEPSRRRSDTLRFTDGEFRMRVGNRRNR